MKKSLKFIVVMAALLVAGIGITHTLTAQTGGVFDLTWSATDGAGGGVSTGGDFELSDTVAQPSGSNLDEMTGGAFVVTGGYWSHRFDPALVVTLDSFTAESAITGIRLRWVTLSEVDTLGFNLYRAAAATGTPVLINPELIPAQAPGGGGAEYDWLDEFVVQGDTYYYWLDALALDGSTQRFGPINATLQDPTALTLTRLNVFPAPGGITLIVLFAGACLLLSRQTKKG